LSEAATGRNVWSQAYDAEVKDIFGVQEDIARRVVGAAAKLTRFERERALGKPTTNLAAYEYVLRGREAFSHATRESNHQAQEMFQRAIELDPSYAALCGARLVAYRGGGVGMDGVCRRRSRPGRESGAESSVVGPLIYQRLSPARRNDLMRGRFDLALGQTDRALEINPSDAESYATRGTVLVWAGRGAEALPWLEGALRFDRTAFRAPLLLGMAYYFLDRYGEAVETLDRALALNLGRNTQLMGRPALAATYAELSRLQDAERERTAALRLSPFLDAARFAGQFGTQQARDHMLEGSEEGRVH
jgi:adenylate cyclase